VVGSLVERGVPVTQNFFSVRGVERMLVGMLGLAGSGLASGMAASRALSTTLGSCCSA